MKTKSHAIESGDADTRGCAFLIWLIIAAIAFGFIAEIFHPSKPHTDGVYESAMETLKKGIPLNEREAQRIYEIQNAKEIQEAKEIERRNGER